MVALHCMWNPSRLSLPFFSLEQKAWVQSYSLPAWLPLTYYPNARVLEGMRPAHSIYTGSEQPIVRWDECLHKSYVHNYIWTVFKLLTHSTHSSTHLCTVREFTTYSTSSVIWTPLFLVNLGSVQISEFVRISDIRPKINAYYDDASFK